MGASFAMHEDARSHNRRSMSTRKGAAITMSDKQKINLKSFMEVEIVGQTTQ